jgi:hypothetical protein
MKSSIESQHQRWLKSDSSNIAAARAEEKNYEWDLVTTRQKARQQNYEWDLVPTRQKARQHQHPHEVGPSDFTVEKYDLGSGRKTLIRRNTSPRR